MSKSQFTIFMLLNARPEWLRLSRDERNEIAGKALSEALEGLKLKHRHYDAEAFSAFCSDVAVFEADNLKDYYFAVERLRDSPFFAIPFFDVVAIIPTVEDGFVEFEEREANNAA